MNETTNEVMETMVTEEPVETGVTDYTEESKGGTGKALAAVLTIGAGIITAGTVVYKKLKAKKVEKPEQPEQKKTKKKLMWVDVPVEDYDEVIDSDAADVESEE